jgi:hypothetical protein
MLYANGCSYTDGFELQQKTNSRYSNILTHLLGYSSHINDAMGGASNARIARTTFRNIVKNKDKIKIAVIQWSACVRWEIYNTNWPANEQNTGYIPLMPARFIKRKTMLKFVDKRMNKLKCTDHFAKHQIYLSEHCSAFYTINNILDTQMLLKSFNIPYIMLTMHDNTFNDIKNLIKKCEKNVYENHIKKEILNTYNTIDFSKSIWPMGDQGILEWCQDRNYPIGPDNHPLEQGHKEFAVFLYNHIRNMK